MARIAVTPRDAEWAEQRLRDMFGEHVRKIRDGAQIDTIFEITGITKTAAMEQTEDVTEVELIGYGWYEDEDEVDERPEGWVELENVIAILRRRAENSGDGGRAALIAAADALDKTYG